MTLLYYSLYISPYPTFLSYKLTKAMLTFHFPSHTKCLQKLQSNLTGSKAGPTSTYIF